MADRDVVVVGAGPAGLAVAIEAARRGLSVAVLEQRDDLVDKACGEGVMPPGVRVLEALGVRARISSADSRPFTSIRYVDADGTSAVGQLPAGALAVRRVALARAMVDRAREVGAEVRFGCTLLSHRRSSGPMLLETNLGPEQAGLLVAADGLASRLRRTEGLDKPCRGARRFGLRRHFRREPWSSSVEVHLGHQAEAYVTPISNDCVGVAFLWTQGAHFVGEGEPDVRWTRLIRKFPRLETCLQGAPAISKIRGAGPLERASRARTADRFALVGDAAGYIDAITGEGISLSLLSAMALARVLPEALARGADRSALLPYEREFSRLFHGYELGTRAVLAIARRPRIRRGAVRLLHRFPAIFDWLLTRAIGR